MNGPAQVREPAPLTTYHKCHGDTIMTVGWYPTRERYRSWLSSQIEHTASNRKSLPQGAEQFKRNTCKDICEAPQKTQGTIGHPMGSRTNEAAWIFPKRNPAEYGQSLLLLRRFYKFFAQKSSNFQKTQFQKGKNSVFQKFLKHK